jgi:hypothetical protein
MTSRDRYHVPDPSLSSSPNTPNDTAETHPKSSGVRLAVVGTGIQWAGQTTLAAQQAIASAGHVLFAVTDPWAARWIRKLNANAESFAYPRDGRPRREIYRQMVARVLESLMVHERVCAAFYGSPTTLSWPAHEAVRQARRLGIQARMLPGVSSLDCLFADLGVDPGQGGCQLFEAGDFLGKGRRVDPRAHTVLFQLAMVGNRQVYDSDDGQRIRQGLAALSAHLRSFYNPHHSIAIYQAATHPLDAHSEQWVDIDSLETAQVTESSSLYVPPYTARPA